MNQYSLKNSHFIKFIYLHIFVQKLLIKIGTGFSFLYYGADNDKLFSDINNDILRHLFI